MTPSVFLFLSPHLDDAALSCGGTIRHLTMLGQRVVVATVFTADAPANQSLSWLAQRNHRAWGLYKSPFAERCKEDINAVEVLAAEYHHLGLLDAMYRQDEDGAPLYQKNVVGVPLSDFDRKLCEVALHVRFRELASQYAGQNLYIFSPLTLGGHVDHLIVRNAIQAVWQDTQIIYYEDFPYAARPGAMQTWLETEKQHGWESYNVSLSEPEIAACVDSVACYTSQLHGLFPSQVEQIQEILQARISFLANYSFSRNFDKTRRRMESYIRGYIAEVGGERFWSRESTKDLQSIFFGNQ